MRRFLISSLMVLLAGPWIGSSADQTQEAILAEMLIHQDGLAAWRIDNAGWLFKAHGVMIYSDLERKTARKVQPSTAQRASLLHSWLQNTLGQLFPKGGPKPPVLPLLPPGCGFSIMRNAEAAFLMCQISRMVLSCSLLFAGLAAAQSSPRTERNIPYAEPSQERRLLDVFAPRAGSSHPVVVWVHGGGWMRGSKDAVEHKPAAFVGKGYVFVPVNYRFIPDVTMDVIVRDVAKAVGWVHANIARYGGDPERIFLMGHSAGAQLAALLCADSRYLEAEGVHRANLKGCVPVDGDTYDVPLQVATATARRKSLNQPPPQWGHPEKFGNLARQRELSAVNHVAPHRGIPPFLLLHVADHTDTAAQAYRLWAALDEAGIPAQLFGAEDTDHVQLDRRLGLPDDPATMVLFEFMDRVLREPPR